MKQRYLLFFLMSLLIGPLDAWAQAITVKGVVKDGANGDALPGVSVVVKGTTTGSMTDLNGAYTIQVPSANATLTFTYIGYLAQDIAVNGRTSIEVGLKADNKTLDEVVVIGYGTVKKSDVTGSVGTVKSEDLLKTIPTSINQSLQGQVAGVQVAQSSGAPGASVSLKIRGTNSFTNSEPLYVIDGIPYTGGNAGTPQGDTGGGAQTTNPLSFINPQDIESMEILKDASATAIYGSRGANGVVLVTTKKGKAGQDRLEFVSNFSVSEVAKPIKVLDAYQYAMFQNEAIANQNLYSGTNETLPYPGTTGVDQVTGQNVYQPAPEDYRSGLPAGTSFPVGFRGSNWQDEIFRRALTQDYTLRVFGGGDNGSYSVSGNVMDQEGTIVNSGFKRYGLQANIDRKIRKIFQIGSNNNVTYGVYKMGQTNTEGNRASVISSAIAFPPTYPVESDPARDQLIQWYAAANPAKYVQNVKDETNSTNIYSSNYAQVQITDWLTARQNVGINYNFSERNIYYNRNIQEGRAPRNGYAQLSQSKWIGLTFESLLNINKTFAEDHTINAVLGHTFEKGQSNWKVFSAQNFPNDILQDYQFSAGTQQNMPQMGGPTMQNLESYLGRVNYSFKGKYLATVSFRRDGSSRFYDDTNRWSNFASFALAWNAAEEAFIQDLNIFSNLKFRVGYGETGNQNIAPYSSRDQVFVYNAVVNGQLVSGLANNQYNGFPNRNLQWERTGMFNGGIDMGFMQNRFNVTIDAYHKKSEGLLQEVLTPPSSGSDRQRANVGTVINKGIEVSLQGTILDRAGFRWNTNANFSINRNKLQGLPGDQFATRLYYGLDNVFIQRNGEPIGTVYGFVSDGFYDNYAEVIADPTNMGLNDETVLRAMIGEVKYKDLNGDGTINNNDRTIIGNTNPKYSFGWTNNFEYKKFNLSVFFQGVQGNDIVNTNLYQITLGRLGNIPQFVYDSRWTPENAASAKFPKAWASDSRIQRFSDRMVEDGSYVRLKNINLGYTFASPFKFVESINVYGSVTNVFTITDYSWFDPDVSAFGNDPSRQGVDMNSYPTSRTFSLGLRVQF